MFVDFENCPQCETLLLRQSEELIRTTPDLIEGVAMDSLYMRVDQEMLKTPAAWAKG